MLPLLPSYIHHVNPKLKHIYLSFDTEGNLLVKSPKVTQQRIEQLLLKKSSWINNARQKIAKKKGKKIDFLVESQIYYLGKSYPIVCIKHEKKNTKLVFEEHTFTLFYHHYDTQLFQKHIDAFYKKEAVKYIIPLVVQWSNNMQRTPKHIAFRKTKRQWGSCSSSNHLSFNTMMMKLPPSAIVYIVVHELAHITHKHHQATFWKLVEKYLPNYKASVKEIKDYST